MSKRHFPTIVEIAGETFADTVAAVSAVIELCELATGSDAPEFIRNVQHNLMRDAFEPREAQEFYAANTGRKVDVLLSISNAINERAGSLLRDVEISHA
jgi:hypothetical protein